ncbi:LuxR family transcriptional regulator [Actinomadura sp. 7K534]|uniref:helix-turn-helix transcriptional regulator n=1 Tax=Actinomadura sp. 7K534 TaxID=2530366 RepID=UPI001A9FB62C|nr:LuxR family transcriptional regulator [Actinomadura sp. 7K534]
MPETSARGRMGAIPWPLVGREAERETLDRLLADVRGGSRVLVLRGETGVGKSALLDHLIGKASGFRVAVAAGVRAEMELPFAHVHQLCAPMLDVFDSLPEARRDALATAFGMHSGPAPDSSLIGLAVLDLLARAAAERPVLCVIDDAQWLDPASAEVLARVARGLTDERVACVLAVRDADMPPDLPVLDVGGLGDGDARALVARAAPGPLDEEVRDRILFESRGNPLVLLELVRGASAGGFAAVSGRSPTVRPEDGVRRRLDGLSDDARTALLLAAAEPLGDPGVLRRAAAVLGLGAAPVGEAGDLLDIGDRVRFRQPLVRFAVYDAAAPGERRRIHRALAEATDAGTGPDRRAWHRAHGADHPDEGIAAELVTSAGRARARGGLAAVAAFLRRAVELTPDVRRRAERALDAAWAQHMAGASESALALLAVAEAGPPDEPHRARVEALRAEIDPARGASTPDVLCEVAGRLGPIDASLARDTYLQALFTAVGTLPDWAAVTGIAAAARKAPRAPGEPRTADLVLDALSLLYTEEPGTAAPALRRAVAAGMREGSTHAEQLRWQWSLNLFAMALWDDEAGCRLARDHLRLIRDSGALALLPLALGMSTMLLLFEGDLAAAGRLNEEAMSKALPADVWTTSEVMRQSGNLGLAAWRGDVQETERLADAVAREGAGRGEWRTVELGHWARSVLYNGLGEYERALEAVLPASVDHRSPHGCGVLWAPLELIEAAVRTGRHEPAVRALERLSRAARAGGTDWGLGLEARCRALLGEGGEADRLYREAIDRLGRTRMRVDLARAHLLYGEWLRRERRRTQAREHLRTALGLFTEFGMTAFADRTARELQATGETARKRSAETAEELTPQEARVAALARTGLTNKEIAARLYVSPRTVEYHLGRVFAKLGVTSRHALDDHL